ncbi:MAG: pseudouridine synthase [Chitinophagaceae bacterium]|nr:pseudouridine synthase [Chitinophagaceae bacterium]
MSGHRYFALYKPRDMVSQFVSADKVPLLGELDFRFPEGTHAIGRLDRDSEGLLLLTTNKKVTRLLFQGEVPHRRDYLVMVKNRISAERLKKLQDGVSFKTFEGADYHTGPCAVLLIEDPLAQFGIRPERPQHIPHSWLHISLTEGKYHQVRKMVAAVHHKCRRLVRVAIEDLTLSGMQPGEVTEFAEDDFFRLLQIRNYGDDQNL